MLDTFISVWKCVENFLEPFIAKIFIFFMKSHVNMMNFHLMSDPKNMHFFSNFTSVTKWDGTLLLSIRGTYNWYLLEAHDLGNMIDAFISVWKCVENFLEPFKAKLFIFFMKSHVKMMYFHNMTDPKNMLFFSIFTSVTKWDGTFLLCVRGTYNWYLLKAYDLGNMLDTFISAWKCVENFLEP